MRVGTRIDEEIEVDLTRDHPHACGDKMNNIPLEYEYTGSSPCVWGQETKRQPKGQEEGIIPMRVGTSALTVCHDDVVQDHPHACGDKPVLIKCDKSEIGSSPCVWGQVHAYIMVDVLCRIIPMRVGTSNTQLINCCKYKDHPHACGDKLICTFSMSKLIGSSPCVWGQGSAYVALPS